MPKEQVVSEASDHYRQICVNAQSQVIRSAR
jgi:hypothetical protein